MSKRTNKRIEKKGKKMKKLSQLININLIASIIDQTEL